MGAVRETQASACPNCGHENPDGNRFCGSCGYRLGDSRSTVPVAESVLEECTEEIRLIAINEDGSDGTKIPLRYTKMVVGRTGDTSFPTDAFLSPKHAALTVDDGVLSIEDLYSLNGTFLKLSDEIVLTPGDVFLMGRQVLRFDKFEHTVTPKARAADGTRYMGSPPPGGGYKLLQVGIGGAAQDVYCIPQDGATLGREHGDFIFPRDKFMSGRHAQIYPREDGTYCLADLNSSNGTWIKIWEKTTLGDADFIFMGQQLFRVELG
jgi:pSer/pThr/pTyr-binding forkhead associated (FHA) protein